MTFRMRTLMLLAMVSLTAAGDAFANTHSLQAPGVYLQSIAYNKPAWRRSPPLPRWQKEEQRWRQYSPQRRAEILRRAKRFQKLPPRAQERLWQEYRQSHPEGRP